MLPFLLLLSGLILVRGDGNALDLNAVRAGDDLDASSHLSNLRGSGGMSTAADATARGALSSRRRLKGKHAADADAEAGAEDAKDDDEKKAGKKAAKGATDDSDAAEKADADDKAGGKDTTAADKADAGGPAKDDLPPANPPPRADESPCVGATTCSDCRDVARSVADVTQMRSTCAWTSGICSEIAMVSGSGREVDDFDCDGAGGNAGGGGPGPEGQGEQQQVLHDQDQDGVGSTASASKAASSSSKYADGDDYYDDYDSGSGVGGILFMMAFFAGMFYYAKTKLLIPGGGLDALARGRSFASGGGADGDDDASTLMGLTWATGLTSRSGGDGRNAEMVPLSAATDDDEWGWEDGGGGGDIEQQSRAEHLARVKEEEDLHTALAMSLSDPSNNKSIGGTDSGSGAKSKTALPRGGSSNSGPKGRSKRGAGRGSAGSRPQRSGSGSASTSGGSGFSRSHSGGSTGSGVRQSVQSEAVPSSPTMGAQKNHTRGNSASSASAAPAVAAAAATAKKAPVPGSAEDIAELLAASRPSYVPESNYISSLSKPKAPPPKKKAEKKKSSEEDDIFASMGLSSAPKFASSSSSSARPPVRKAAAATAAPTRPTTSSPAAAAAATAKAASLAATSEDMGDADWDEDSDLDDLLDD